MSDGGPLAQPFRGKLDGFLTGDFQGGGAVEAGGEQFLDDGLDADDSGPQRNESHAAAELRAAQRQHVLRHVLPMHVFDARAEGFHELERIAAAEPGVAGVEVDADGFLMAERVEDAGHALHGIGEDAVRLQQ